MNIIDYKSIVKQVMINGNLHGDMRTFFNSIGRLLYIKDEDVKPEHPLKIERMKAKMAAIEAIKKRMAKGLPVSKQDMIEVKQFEYDNQKPRKTRKKPIKSVADIVAEHNKLDGTLFIINGDCGFGSRRVEYYTSKLERLNKILAYNNAYVLFVRGNNDDPSYFDGKVINYSNIKAVPDYTVVLTDKHNILCVGGAISHDRSWRIKQEERLGKVGLNASHKKIYWEKEGVVFNKSQIDEIINSGIKIDIVVSHTAPSFVEPQERNDIESWGVNDKKLFEDTFESRVALDKVYEALRDSGSRPVGWFFSHFDVDSQEKRSQTIFKSMFNGFVNADNFLSKFNRTEAERKKLSNMTMSLNDESGTLDEMEEFFDEAENNEGGEVENDGEVEQNGIAMPEHLEAPDDDAHPFGAPIDPRPIYARPTEARRIMPNVPGGDAFNLYDATTEQIFDRIRQERQMRRAEEQLNNLANTIGVGAAAQQVDFNDLTTIGVNQTVGDIETAGMLGGELA